MDTAGHEVPAKMLSVDKDTLYTFLLVLQILNIMSNYFKALKLGYQKLLLTCPSSPELVLHFILFKKFFLYDLDYCMLECLLKLINKTVFLLHL